MLFHSGQRPVVILPPSLLALTARGSLPGTVRVMISLPVWSWSRHEALAAWRAHRADVCAEMALGGGEAIWACRFPAPRPAPSAWQPSDEHRATGPPVGARQPCQPRGAEIEKGH